MKWFSDILGLDKGDHLTMEQMCLRALIIFIIGLLYLRISGRRSFGMASPFDNVIGILLGSILSRAVVGASPFFPILGAAALLAVLHRLFGLIGIYNSSFGSLIKGEPLVLYENGEMNRPNMRKALISINDIRQSVRKECNTESFDSIDKVIAERNGELSILFKNASSNTNPSHGL